MGEPFLPAAKVDIDKLTPLADMVLVRRLPDEETTHGGLIVPGVARNKREGLRVGLVLRVGMGDTWRVPYDQWSKSAYPRDNSVTIHVMPIMNIAPCDHITGVDETPVREVSGRWTMQVKPGDRVVYSRVEENNVNINGEDLVLLREEQHVLAVLEPSCDRINCGSNEIGLPLHDCPYSDVSGDKRQCTCCDGCTQRCAMEV
jgi:co-chaperonin GroES (HSP10)